MNSKHQCTRHSSCGAMGSYEDLIMIMICNGSADNAIRKSEVLDSIPGKYYGGRHDEFWLRSDSWPGLK